MKSNLIRKGLLNHLMVKKVTRAIEKSKIDFEWKSEIGTLTVQDMSKPNAILMEVMFRWCFSFAHPTSVLPATMVQAEIVGVSVRPSGR
jgi:hypothetical protein